MERRSFLPAGPEEEYVSPPDKEAELEQTSSLRKQGYWYCSETGEWLPQGFFSQNRES